MTVIGTYSVLTRNAHCGSFSSLFHSPLHIEGFSKFGTASHPYTCFSLMFSRRTMALFFCRVHQKRTSCIKRFNKNLLLILLQVRKWRHPSNKLTAKACFCVLLQENRTSNLTNASFSRRLHFLGCWGGCTMWEMFAACSACASPFVNRFIGLLQCTSTSSFFK